MDILDEVGKHITEEASEKTLEAVKKGMEINPTENDVHLANLVKNEDGELTNAPWMNTDVGPVEDMSVEELEEHLGETTESKMSVKEVIDMMNDPNVNVMLKAQERRKPRVPAKVKKKKKKIAKASRRANRKK